MSRFESTEATAISTTASTTSAFHEELSTLQNCARLAIQQKDTAGLADIMLVRAEQPKADEQVSSPGQLTEDASKAWDHAMNHKGLKDAYKEVAPKFEVAISAADEAYNKAAPAILAKLAKLEPELDRHQNAENAAYRAAGDVLNKLSRTDFAQFNKWAIEYLKIDENKRTKEALGERLGQVPGLKDAADNLEKGQRAQMAVYGKDETDPEVVKAKQAVKLAEKSVQDIVKKLPEDEQNGVLLSVKKYTHIEPRVDLDRQQFLRFMLDLKPGLVKTIDDVKAVFRAAEPTRAKGRELSSQMTDILNDRLDARRGYRDAANLAGEAGKREEMQKQIDAIRTEARKFER